MVRFSIRFNSGLRREAYLSSVGETNVPDTLKLVSPGSEKTDFRVQKALTVEKSVSLVFSQQAELELLQGEVHSLLVVMLDTFPLPSRPYTSFLEIAEATK
jgi:hypothetical protein